LKITPDDVIHIFYGLKDDNSVRYFTKPVSGGSWSGDTRLDNSQPGGCPAPDPGTPGVFPTGGWCINPAMDSSGGLYFMWLHLFDDNGLNPTSALWGRYKPLGGSWGCIELVDGTDGNDWPGGSWMTVNGNDFYVTFGVDAGAVYRKRTGGAWGPRTTIWPSGGGARLAFSPTGEWAQVWAYDIGGGGSGPWWEVFARFSYDQGQTWTTPYNVSNYQALDRSPEIVYDAGGRLHVAWQWFGEDGGKPEMMLKTHSGGVWSDMVNLSNTPNDRSGEAFNALTARGNTLYYAWGDTYPDGYEEVYFIENPQPTTLIVDPLSINVSTFVGSNPANSQFTIRNGGAGTVNYTISESASWLDTNPDSGSSTTEVDTITVTFDADELAGGVYNANIQINSDAMSNPNETISVTLTVETVGPDFDGDADVDGVDYGHLQACYSGVGIQQTAPECQDAKLDADDDVDADDFTVYLDCVSGANVPAVPGCDN
jgi:hypothetical protein